MLKMFGIKRWYSSWFTILSLSSCSFLLGKSIFDDEALFHTHSFFLLVVSPNLQIDSPHVVYTDDNNNRKKDKKKDKKKDESSNGHQTIVRGVQDSQTTRSIIRRLLESTKTQTTTRFSDRNFTGDDSSERSRRRRRRRWKERIRQYE